MKTEVYSEYFTSRIPHKNAGRLISWWHRRMLKIVKKYVPNLSKKTLLEIGPGHGFFAETCKDQGIKYFAYEQNDAQAQALQRKGFEVVAAKVPPFPIDRPVQIIWLSHVLEHVSSHESAKALLEACYAKLEMGGYLVIIAPDLHHWKTEFWSVDWSHGFPTSLNRVEQLLNETNFGVHQSMHHTFTMTNPLIAWFLSSVFRLLIPTQVIDAMFYKLFKHKFCHSFMTLLGLRQILLIGEKVALKQN